MCGKNKLILCSRNVNLFNTPFRRFTSFALMRQMMRNYILDILKEADISPEKLRIAYYDPKAEYPLFVEDLITYTSRLTVVSNMPRFYENEADRIIEASGASVYVSSSVESLYKSDIIICPSMITDNIISAASALVFTVCRPTSAVNGNVIYKYNTNWPENLIKLVPSGIDRDYFMSALYVIEKQKKLGECIPKSCGDEFETYSKDLIIRMIRAKCMFE